MSQNLNNETTYKELNIVDLEGEIYTKTTYTTLRDFVSFLNHTYEPRISIPEEDIYSNFAGCFGVIGKDIRSFFIRAKRKYDDNWEPALYIEYAGQYSPEMGHLLLDLSDFEIIKWRNPAQGGILFTCVFLKSKSSDSVICVVPPGKSNEEATRYANDVYSEARFYIY